MPLTKTSSAILTGQTTTTTSSAIDVSSSYISDVYVSATQVGTATSAASFQVLFSPDSGTTWYSGQLFTAGLNAGTYYWIINVPNDATHIKIAYTQQSGGSSSTLTAQVGMITGL